MTLISSTPITFHSIFYKWQLWNQLYLNVDCNTLYYLSKLFFLPELITSSMEKVLYVISTISASLPLVFVFTLSQTYWGHLRTIRLDMPTLVVIKSIHEAYRFSTYPIHQIHTIRRTTYCISIAIAKRDLTSYRLIWSRFCCNRLQLTHISSPQA